MGIIISVISIKKAITYEMQSNSAFCALIFSATLILGILLNK